MLQQQVAELCREYPVDGFKYADARRYEAAAMIAFGAVCNIGEAYACVEQIEDLIPLRNVTVELRVPEEVRSARLVPVGRKLAIEREGDLA